jgi:hypothetical protein
LNGKNADGFFYLVRPPLLPLYLNLFHDPLVAGALLNIFSFAITIFMCLKVARLLGLHGADIYLLAVSVIFSYSLLQCHLFLWTDAAFTATVMILFYCLITERPIQYVILWLTVAFLFRKAAGFTTIATVALYFNRHEIRNGLIIAATMIILFAAWEALTFYHTSSLLSAATWSGHAALPRIPYVDSFTSWLLPRVLPIALRLLIIAVVMTAIVLSRRSRCARYFKDSKFQSLFIYWFTYACCLVVFWGVEDFHDADRFLAAILPFVMLTLFSFAWYVFDSKSDRRYVRAIMVLWLVYPVSKTLYYLFIIHR